MANKAGSGLSVAIVRLAVCWGGMMLMLNGAHGAARTLSEPQEDRRPVWLWVDVRQSPPPTHNTVERAGHGGYSVSTGGADDTAGNDATRRGNGWSVATKTDQTRVHVLSGERLRVDMPTVQSLQFHAPVNATAGRTGITGNGAAAASGTTGSNAPQAAAPGVGGEIFFEAVGSFAARFFTKGKVVRIELQPLQVGGVYAPRSDSRDPRRDPIQLTGSMGEWIPLGDTDLPPVKGLTATPNPPQPASVWVRVWPESAGSN